MEQTKSLCVRLRGGADTVEDGSFDNMKDRAMLNARFHGVSMHPGVENLGNGNCAFETVLDSINTRECFPDKFEGPPDYWRRLWMTEVEKVAFNDWRGNMSKAEWKDGWKVLKES